MIELRDPDLLLHTEDDHLHQTGGVETETEDVADEEERGTVEQAGDLGPGAPVSLTSPPGRAAGTSHVELPPGTSGPGGTASLSSETAARLQETERDVAVPSSLHGGASLLTGGHRLTPRIALVSMEEV